MLRGTGWTPSVTHTTGAAADGCSAPPKALVVLVKTNAPTPANVASSRSVSVPVMLVSTKLRRLCVMTWGLWRVAVQDGVDPCHALLDHVPVTDGAELVGEVRWPYVETDDLMVRVLQRPHQRFPQMPTAPCYQDFHASCLSLVANQAVMLAVHARLLLQHQPYGATHEWSPACRTPCAPRVPSNGRRKPVKENVKQCGCLPFGDHARLPYRQYLFRCHQTPLCPCRDKGALAERGAYSRHGLVIVCSFNRWQGGTERVAERVCTPPQPHSPGRLALHGHHTRQTCEAGGDQFLIADGSRERETLVIEDASTRMVPPSGLHFP